MVARSLFAIAAATWWAAAVVVAQPRPGREPTLDEALPTTTTSGAARRTTTPTTTPGDDAAPLFSRAITVAVVANEFFDRSVTRMGGFGFSTRMISDVFRRHPAIGVDLVFVLAAAHDRVDGNGTAPGEVWVHGRPLINLRTTTTTTRVGSSSAPTKKKTAAALTTEWAQAYLEAKRVDLFLFIDYRKNYLDAHRMLPDVPIIIWARDPRTQRQRKLIKRITVPGAPPPTTTTLPHTTTDTTAVASSSSPQQQQQHHVVKAQGTSAPDARHARRLIEHAPTKVAIGMTWGPALRDRTLEAYNVSSSSNATVDDLPNVIATCADDGERLEPKPRGTEAATPEVLFLARLDPYKRPWLLVALARAYPHVTFVVAGQSHFRGSGAFEPPAPDEVPNLVFLGHVASEAEKADRLARAWFIVNLSVHEGVAISFLEALHCRTPIVATVDPGGLVSSYGEFAGDWPGDGTAGLPAIKQAFDALLTSPDRRAELGVAGRKHVLETHNARRFFDKFASLAHAVGVR